MTFPAQDLSDCTAFWDLLCTDNSTTPQVNNYTEISDEPMYKVSGAIDGINHPCGIVSKF